MQSSQVIIIGAGAAGLMCAIEAGKRGRRVTVLEKANKPGKKILMSGGGRCNFTNLHINPGAYISHNPHFCKSALSRYTQWDFIQLVQQYRIPHYEKTLGQLFCENKSHEILDMVLKECEKAGVQIFLNADTANIEKLNDGRFKVTGSQGEFVSESLVIASGGLSVPTMGAGPFGYKVAEKFNIPVWPTRAGLVPFTLDIPEKERLSVLSGVSADCLIRNDRIQFRENILFTHRGLSGPAVLQMSSYWMPGETVTVNLLPEVNVYELLKSEKQSAPNKLIKSILSELLPKRLTEIFVSPDMAERKVTEVSDVWLQKISECFHSWTVKPSGTEGYRTAEVTLGGVDCNAISSKTMEASTVPGLYFIGEVLDVTGWLGGYNFQWAWSSGWAAGQWV